MKKVKPTQDIYPRGKLKVLLIDTVYHLLHNEHLHPDIAAEYKREFSRLNGVESMGSLRFFGELKKYFSAHNMLDDFITTVHSIDHDGKVYDMKPIPLTFNSDHQWPII